MENKELHNLKISTIDSISSPEYEIKKYFFINFQGIPLRFYSDSDVFCELVKNLTPIEWAESELCPEQFFSIYHYDIAKFSIDIELWSQESSQDCYFLEDKVVHRDFCSKKISKNSYLLICQENDSDGIFNFLRMLLPKLLFTKNKYIIHSSCVLLKDGSASLFLGHSGHGKTTIASLCGERKILSDDMNIIDMNTLRVSAACLGHAYHTNGSYDKSYKISKIFWILKSDKNDIEPISVAKSSLILLSSVTNLFWDQLKEEEIQKTMKDVSEISKEIPMHLLYFTKSEKIWTIID